jgi:hypothetical protein
MVATSETQCLRGGFRGRDEVQIDADTAALLPWPRRTELKPAWRPVRHDARKTMLQRRRGGYMARDKFPEGASATVSWSRPPDAVRYAGAAASYPRRPLQARDASVTASESRHGCLGNEPARRLRSRDLKEGT